MAKVWYPVIDYVKCEECGLCINNCTRGIYDKGKAPSPVVVNPDGCVDHCKDCGNLCPQGAITYVGDDTGWMSPHEKITNKAACSRCSDKPVKEINIDFLYLDLNTCERCMDTDTTLIEAVDDLSGLMDTLEFRITVNKVNITSAEMAEKHRFLSSPTIRINGRDICAEVKENNCRDCGDLCGEDVNCRVFVYNGREFNQPPKAMIIDGILKSIYGQEKASESSAYFLSENLNKFFAGVNDSCCDERCSCR